MEQKEIITKQLEKVPNLIDRFMNLLAVGVSENKEDTSELLTNLMEDFVKGCVHDTIKLHSGLQGGKIR